MTTSYSGLPIPEQLVQSGTYKLVQLASGAWSLHSTEYGETFHPVIGPVAEAEALYLKQIKLLERLEQHEGEFVIWDIGLGAAANVLTLLRAACQSSAKLRVISFDYTLEPLEFSLQRKDDLGYLAGYEETLRQLIQKHEAEFQNGHKNVNWKLYLGDFPTFLTTPTATAIPKPHVILFDAFSPARNPAMWTLPLFTALFRLLDRSRPCAMPTYSRSTMLRVTLLLAGFYVGVGHATGEKEETTIAANTLELIREPLNRTWLEKARRSSSAEPMNEALYRQLPISEENWEKLQKHPQFSQPV